jgi:hypothetical protein
MRPGSGAGWSPASGSEAGRMQFVGEECMGEGASGLAVPDETRNEKRIEEGNLLSSRLCHIL